MVLVVHCWYYLHPSPILWDLPRKSTPHLHQWLRCSRCDNLLCDVILYLCALLYLCICGVCKMLWCDFVNRFCCSTFSAFVMFLCVCKMLWCDFVNPWGKPTPAVWWDALCGLWPNFSLLELEICIFVLSLFVFVYFLCSYLCFLLLLYLCSWCVDMRYWERPMC